MSSPHFELGAKLKDTVTGLEGIAIARLEYMNGCIQYCVKPKLGTETTGKEGEYIDSQQLVQVGRGLLKRPPAKKKAAKNKRTGGPNTVVIQSDTPPRL